MENFHDKIIESLIIFYQNEFILFCILFFLIGYSTLLSTIRWLYKELIVKQFIIAIPFFFIGYLVILIVISAIITSPILLLVGVYTWYEDSKFMNKKVL